MASPAHQGNEPWSPPVVPVGAARPYQRRLFVELTRSTDAAVALLVLGIAFVVSNADHMPRGLNDFLLPRFTFANVVLLGAFAIVWKHIFLWFGLYDVAEARSLRAEAPAVVAACAVGAGASFVFPLLSHSGAFTWTTPLVAWPLITASTLSLRYALRKVAERAHFQALASSPTRVLIIGSGPLAHRSWEALVRDVTAPSEVVGFVDTNPAIAHEHIRRRIIGTLDDLESILMHNVVDQVLVALPIKSRYEEIERVIVDCERAGVQLKYSADVFRTARARVRHDSGEGRSIVTMEVVTNDYRLVIKRGIDIITAAVGLVIAAPIFAAIAVAIKATSPGPVVFGQERYGWRKRLFRMYKFRTMVIDAEALQATLEGRNEASGPVFKIRDDPRITRVGRFLRKTSLDELPQLWNVLRGDMSLVGPRPMATRDVHRFTQAELMRRFSVKPGMTCLWQISGRSSIGFDEWIRLDLEYIDNWSLSSDFGILARTIPAVIRGEGAV